MHPWEPDLENKTIIIIIIIIIKNQCVSYLILQAFCRDKNYIHVRILMDNTTAVAVGN
jgi:hypothetical protein